MLILSHLQLKQQKKESSTYHMKITNESSPVEVGGAVSSPQQFRINASKEAFLTLSNGLYNNKKLAIVRELSCNAYDAHVAAGKKDVPFEVHLPTKFEPFFSVKDYGTGMSHEDVISLYTTYFSSSRSNSNEFVGALGLGSKSPFCYTEGFSITSRFEEVTRIYSAYINEQGPTILLQSEEETPGEQNGIEVSFPVNQNDCWEFSNQARSAYEFFDPLPIINTNIDIKKAEYKIKTKNWGLRVNSSSGIRAIQGMVPYSVGSIDISKTTGIQSRLLGLPLDVFFPIGELSVAASRETLSNDERTIKNILIALDKIGTEFVEQVKIELAKCETLWQARLILFNYGNVQGGLGTIVNDAFRSGAFDGQYKDFFLSKKDETFKLNELDYTATSIVKFTRNYQNPVQASKYKVFSMDEQKKIVAVGLITTKNVKKEEYDRIFDISPKIMFVINDVGFGGEKYIHHLIQDSGDFNGKESVYFITRATTQYGIPKVVEDGLKMIKLLGNPPVMMLSELRNKYKDEFVSKAKNPTPAVKRDVLWLNQNNNIHRYRNGYEASGWRDGWEAATTFPTGRKYYIIVKGLEPIQQPTFQFAEDLSNFMNAVRGSKAFDFTSNDKLYAFAENSPLKDDPEWIEFFSYTFSTLKTVLTPELEMKLSALTKPFNSDFNQLFTKVVKDKNLLDSESSLQKFAERYDKLRRYSELDSARKLGWLMDKMEKLGKYKRTAKLIDFNEEWKVVKAKYPMLELSSRYYYGSSDYTKIILDYIGMVDKYNNEKETQEVVTLAMAVAETVKKDEEEIVTIN